MPLHPTSKHSVRAQLKVCVLASGSRGNAIYVSSGDTGVLIDAGLSGAEIERRMRFRKIPITTLKAIIVSHEHADHIRGVGVLSRRHHLPVYISERTAKTAAAQLGRITGFHYFSCGSAFTIRELNIRPFSISHDAEDPAGFTIECNGGCNGKKIGIATDLGIATAMVKQHLKGCCCLILEANHDLALLEQGPYPWPLKQRIRSRTGHLSNESAQKLLREVMHDRLAHVILAHLSEINNTPEKALSVVSRGFTHNPPAFIVASQDQPGPLIRIPE